MPSVDKTNAGVAGANSGSGTTETTIINGGLECLNGPCNFHGEGGSTPPPSELSPSFTTAILFTTAVSTISRGGEPSASPNEDSVTSSVKATTKGLSSQGPTPTLLKQDSSQTRTVLSTLPKPSGKGTDQPTHLVIISSSLSENVSSNITSPTSSASRNFPSGSGSVSPPRKIGAGVIAGAVIGSVLGLLVLLLLFFVIRRRFRRFKAECASRDLVGGIQVHISQVVFRHGNRWSKISGVSDARTCVPSLREGLDSKFYGDTKSISKEGYGYGYGL